MQHFDIIHRFSTNDDTDFDPKARFPDDLREGLSEREHQIVKRIIRNLKIRVNHRAEARTSSKIERLTQTPASSKS
ncbi:hypothetical protein RhiirA5_410245 [Rhizophagus irregularis]|uniref:Uncharacterized protein n=2 Tax=Rhizophagus irregularis TaxID=588596 RepID=U9SSE2_RHIID|nr:hypothetical protein GLOIN_2v1778318 [Rhizophagus irregularis DAOM 181602=DAOM 197198]PKC13730.1 hypothetical protein RhiirA5_410245 [Rhizophagus irregularis]PKY43572.1 hypothetical protein RhiirA4_457582 [Rhizophagus irregularis]POG68419.1 hypothetical protein GLOIN_2v1778318 [Rhizophagus irregularis DAOM 181602=DAOM 197198]CAG8669034.1 12900_t:CDS:2 [Rhizophagus irregularis]GET49946.1 Piwi domain-containing protein [Rhizophagus irregularis DAOM 181602=DAOM 197198]|eukprot:XP_025175285.1 hypothetical protein GLOIN_2v1778318 [Rhizophagus irregularis DAOM 181602=DAOM 197198]